MARALIVIAIIFLAILGVSAIFFDSTTLLAIGVTMLIVSFFAGAAVVLGVITRRMEERREDRADRGGRERL